jgi:predicted peptidase
MNFLLTLVLVISLACMARPMIADDAVNPPAIDPAAVFEARVFESPGGGSIPYRLLKPLDYDPQRPGTQQKFPLVLLLHGAGERGVDNKLQLFHGCRDLAAEAMRRRHPAFVVVPQCPLEKRWVEVPWDAPSHQMPAEMSDPLRLTLELLAALEKEFPIDAGRRYATGLSMGGYGVWDVLQRKPGYLAAAAPICAGGDPAYAEGFASTPIWAFHGDADATVMVNRSREMVGALRAAGGQPVYTEYEGVGHDSWTATLANRCLWDWLFAQRKSSGASGQ